MMRMHFRAHAAVAALAAILAPLVSPGAARACDLCSVYTATILQESRTGAWFGMAQQFSSFGTLRDGTGKVSNPSSEWLESSITQLAIGYKPSPVWGVQLNVPIIARRYRRVGEEGGIEKDSVEGIGDASLVLHYDVLSDAYRRGVFVVRVHGGLKLATGNSDRLGREAAHHAEEGDHAEAANDDEARRSAFTAGNEIGEPASGVHDHDLALGSGSLDGLLGVSFLWTRGRFQLAGDAQYALRTEGDFDYEYADDLTWSLSPGVYTALAYDYTVGFAARLSGERKGKDERDGDQVEDSGIVSVYAGPRLTVTQGSQLHFEVGGEVPLHQDTSALQLVPDYRLHLSASVRF